MKPRLNYGKVAPGSHAYLAEHRLLQGDLDHRLLHVPFHPILGAGLEKIFQPDSTKSRVENRPSTFN